MQPLARANIVNLSFTWKPSPMIVRRNFKIPGSLTGRTAYLHTGLRHLLYTQDPKQLPPDPRVNCWLRLHQSTLNAIRTFATEHKMAERDVVAAALVEIDNVAVLLPDPERPLPFGHSRNLALTDT
jgi:hypothetical protein